MFKKVYALKNIRLKNIRSLEVYLFVCKRPGSSIREVAEGLDISYQTAHRYMRELRGKGKLIVNLRDMNTIHRFYPRNFDKANPVLMDIEEIIIQLLTVEE